VPEAAADEVPPQGKAVDPPVSEPAEPESRGSESRAPEEPAGSLPTRDEVTLAWGDHILGRLSQRTRSRWASGRFLAVDEAAVYGLPNDVTCRRCGEQQAEVEQALEAHFGRPVSVRLVVDDQSAPPPDALDPATVTRREEATEPADDEIGPIDELEDAGDGGGDGVSKLTDAFPGAELVDVEDEAL
jgi:hypothetical protein